MKKQARMGSGHIVSARRLHGHRRETELTVAWLDMNYMTMKGLNGQAPIRYAARVHSGVKMSRVSREVTEQRRGMVAFLRAMNVGPYEIARTVDVSPRTVYNDFKALEASPITAPEAANHLRGVKSHLLLPTSELLDHPDPRVRLMAVRTFWTIYERAFVLEQGLGLIPMEPDADAAADFSEALQEFFMALAGRLSSDATREFAMALKSLDVEEPKLVARLGLD